MCGKVDVRSVCPSCHMGQTICSRPSDKLPALYLVCRFANADLNIHCLVQIHLVSAVDLWANNQTCNFLNIRLSVTRWYGLIWLRIGTSGGLL
jgi:hypothetical protein